MSLMVVEKDPLAPLLSSEPQVYYQLLLPVTGPKGLLGLLNMSPDTTTPQQLAILFQTLLNQIPEEDMGHA